MNNQSPSTDAPRVELRRYPNRRYYDSARSQHLTLEDIYRLIRDGHNISVCDSKTGEDITARVLEQLILEHDPPKLAAFPAELLHQIIRSNESLLRDFVEKYFNQALAAFLKSQREFNRYLGQTMGLYGLPAVGHGWAEMMMGPFMRAFVANNPQAATSEALPAPSPPPADADLRRAVENLNQQLTTLREELDRR
jgi:polyhydroxyalkanoate synthesis repressor PhaR